MAIEIDFVSDEGNDAFHDAVAMGFLRPGDRGQGDFRRDLHGPDLRAGRFIAARDGEHVVGTFANHAGRVTVPGGREVAVSEVSAVTVAPSHRRRGILTSMMARGLRQSADLGDALSILIPAEWPIYGRFGYGHATDDAAYRFTTKLTAVSRPLPGSVEVVSGQEWVRELPASYDRLRAATPGAVTRGEKWWARTAGLLTPDGKPSGDNPMFMLYRDESGIVRGGASYQFTDGRWTGFTPDGATEAELVAEDPVARVRILQFLWELDWANSLTVSHFPVDDSWRHLLANPRYALAAERYDVLWARVLDAPAALSARTYEGEGRLVLAVTDPDGYADGVFALEGGPNGASVKRTTEAADLTLPVQTLGALYFGNHAATALARVGELTEDRPGALAVADRMFKTAIPPYCATWF